MRTETKKKWSECGQKTAAIIFRRTKNESLIRVLFKQTNKQTYKTQQNKNLYKVIFFIRI